MVRTAKGDRESMLITKIGGFYVGQPVRVKGYRGVRHIQCFYLDIKGGCRLDRPIVGFVSWNVKDLRRA